MSLCSSQYSVIYTQSVCLMNPMLKESRMCIKNRKLLASKLSKIYHIRIGHKLNLNLGGKRSCDTWKYRENYMNTKIIICWFPNPEVF